MLISRLTVSSLSLVSVEFYSLCRLSSLLFSFFLFRNLPPPALLPSTSLVSPLRCSNPIPHIIFLLLLLLLFPFLLGNLLFFCMFSSYVIVCPGFFLFILLSYFLPIRPAPDMDLSSQIDAYVSRLPNLAILATPSNSDSPAPPRLPSPLRLSEPSFRRSPGPSRRFNGRRGARANLPYICTRSCQMNHHHIRPRPSRNARPRRSSSRASPHLDSPPSSPRREPANRSSSRGSTRRPVPRSTGTRRPASSYSRNHGLGSPVQPLFSSRLVIVTISNNEVIDVASFAS